MALAQQDKRVIVLDGDGSALMNLGTLATIAHNAPNYLLVILDNCRWFHRFPANLYSAGKDLSAIAAAAGVHATKTVSSFEDLRKALSGKGVIVVKVEPGNADVPIIYLPQEKLIDRFRQSFHYISESN